MDSQIPLSITSISQFIRLQNCERYLRFRLFPNEAKEFLDRWNLTIQPLTPLLEDSGARFEKAVERFLESTGEVVIDLEGEDKEVTLEWMKQVDEPVLIFQAMLSADIGNFNCRGRADIVRLSRADNGELNILIGDIKASRKERMEHCLQVALYARVIEEMAKDANLPIGSISGTVLHMDEDGDVIGWDPKNSSVDLPTYYMVLDRVLIAEDCLAGRIASAEFEDVFYHLNYRCDGCLFNSICMYDSAERHDLSLISSITAAEKRALNVEGVRELADLAGLMDLPERGSGEYQLTVADGKGSLYQQLTRQWSIAPNLPMIVQKAKASLRQFDRSVDAAPFLFNSGFGSLPSEESYPELIKIFFDAQKDYLQDRLYLISSLIKGPKGERLILHRTDGPPSDSDERDLIMSWIRDTLRAMTEVAADEYAHVHLYCYDRFDQKILLESLKRHIDDVGIIPGFFDLMTQSPALEQPIVSFLADELREHKNFGLVCMPLHDAARYLGFDWQDDQYEFFSLFRARLFDNRRSVLRNLDGTIIRASNEEDSEDAVSHRIESASRFNSQIPLEYVYGVWGRLPEAKEDSRVLQPFLQIDADALDAFAVHRVKALASIEDRISPKNKLMEKAALHLPEITSEDFDHSLARSLKDFLYIEHHTSLQTKEIIYRLPIEQRIRTGLALLLKCQAKLAGGRYRFQVETESLGLDYDLVMNACRLKEGSWIVLNEYEQNFSPSRIKYGRIGIVQEYGENWVEVELLGITFRNGTFRYFHRSNLDPELGDYYTIDEMADDINADKILLALNHAPTNTLYQWLLDAPDPDPITNEQVTFYQEFLGLINQVMGRSKLTAKQSKVIAERIEDKLFLVQGPPGTGKSVTLAWAVIARLAWAAANNEPLRVAVCGKTHNAANIVLEAIAEQLKRLSGFALRKYGLDKLQEMRVIKLVNDPDDTTPPGVEGFAPRPSSNQDRANVLNEHWVVYGGTPGGIYNLRRYYDGRVKDIKWNEKSYDLLVIDEASQMSVPEALLSAAFLGHNGKIIVVGDHRQMPPIVAHDWKEEERRSIQENEPYLSLFEFLRDRGFPCEGLDRSFRLHEVIAEFLNQNIYLHDGIKFYSRRRDLLTQPPLVDPYVDAVLHPEYPIVVVEHDENQSQQYNLTEIELARPLIDICAHKLRLDGLEGIGIVVPHRAQRAMLRTFFPELAQTDSIDTVERFQGGERDVIIVSATASDPDYVLAEADFLLNINRLNVALSRPRMKLIVIASRSVVDLLTSDIDVFENAVIWKQLFHRYTPATLFTGKKNGSRVWVRGKSSELIAL